MDRDDQRCWKAGIFYFNRDDPAILAPKRSGFGWTLNYAHPAAWVWTFGAPVAVAVLITLGKR